MVGNLDKALNDLVVARQLAAENLSREQFVEVLKQAIAAGDFLKYVATTHDGLSAQQIVYLPYRRVQELETEIERLRIVLEESDIQWERRIQLHYEKH